MKHTPKRLIACLASMALLLSACGGEAGPSASVPSKEEGGSKTDLVVAMSQDLYTYDPIGSSAASDQIIYRLIYAHLFETDEDGRPYPELAKSYEQISATEYVFTIYEGARFSDGSEITAEDVAYSLERAHQSEAFATLMATVDTIEATGDYEITITTTGPSPALYLALAHPGTGILPKSYLEQAEQSGDWSAPITSGRYTIGTREEGVSLTILKAENYFNAEDAAQNDSLTFKNVPEDSNRTILVQTGEADVSAKFGTADYETVQEDDTVTLHEAPSGTVQYIGFDITLAPFDNKLVRQAVAYALDRDGILQVAADGLGIVSYTVLPPSTLGYQEENPAGYEYNVEKAKELMAEAGYADGFDTEIMVFSDTAETIATLAQGYLEAIGINAKVRRYDTSVRYDMMAKHQCPVFSASWGALSDAELVLPRLFTEGATYNWSNYHSAELDQMLQEAREASDEDARAAIYAKAVALLAEESPWVPLYVPYSYALARADLQGVALDVDGLIQLYKLHY